MSKEQAFYLAQINQKAAFYRIGLETFQQLSKDGFLSRAAETGFKTILQSNNAVVPGTNELPILIEACSKVLEGIETFISPNLPLPELVCRLEGILIERHAFYRQLKNSSN